MRITDLYENQEHADALATTGFWGKAGAGAIFLSRSTNRILLNYRSAHVEQPHTFGNYGGAIDSGESPEEAVRREAYEETGHAGPFEAIPLFIFKSGTFTYYNYLVVVDDEFTPVDDWESEGHQWCEYGNWPQPLHFGLKSLFSDPASVATIQAEIEDNAKWILQ